MYCLILVLRVYDTIATWLFLYSNRLFEIAPDLKELFPFKEDELSDEHEGLRKHALQVMESVDLAINLLDDSDELVETLVSLGIVHNMSNVRVDSFAVSQIFCLLFPACGF